MFDILYHPYADHSGDGDGDGHITKTGGCISKGRCVHKCPFHYLIIPFTDRGGETLIRTRIRGSMCPNIRFTFVIILYAGVTVKGDTKTGGLMSRGRCFYPFIDGAMVTSRSGVGICLIFSIILMQTKVVMVMVMVMSPKQVDT